MKKKISYKHEPIEADFIIHYITRAAKKRYNHEQTLHVLFQEKWFLQGSWFLLFQSQLNQLSIAGLIH